MVKFQIMIRRMRKKLMKLFLVTKYSILLKINFLLYTIISMINICFNILILRTIKCEGSGLSK